MTANPRITKGVVPEDFSAKLDGSLVESLFTAPKLTAEVAPPGKAFGDVETDAPASVAAGGAVEATFIGGNLRSDLRTQDSYVFVERRDGDSWQLVAEDADPETRLIAAKKGLTLSPQTFHYLCTDFAAASAWIDNNK